MRIKTILTIIVVLMLVAVVAVVVILKSMDFNEYRDLIAQKVTEATGRELKINGELELKLSLSPVLAINDVTFANAAWGSRPDMVKIKRLEIKLSLLPLISGDILINHFVLIEPDILLETDVKGSGNWIFGTGEKPSVKPDSSGQDTIIPLVNEVRIKNASLAYRDGSTEKTIHLLLNSLKVRSADLQSPVFLDIDGAYDKIRFEVAAKLGPLGQLKNPSAPYPINLEAKALGVSVKADGIVKKPLDGKGFDLKLSVKIPDLTKVSKLAGVQLPHDGPFQITARLTDSEKTISLNDIQAEFGRSNLAGAVSVKTKGKRPLINASFTSLNLDLNELKLPAEKEEKKPQKLIFSDDPLPLEGLQIVDANIKISNGRILSNGLELKNIKLDMNLKDGKLLIHPLKSSIAGGSLLVDISLDTRGTKTASVKAKVDIKKVDIGSLLKDMKITDLVSSGKINLKVDVQGRGNSLHKLMAGLNGKISLVMGEGRIENKYVDFIAADLIKLIIPGGAKKEYTTVNCVVSRFDIKKGLAKNKELLFDTENMTITGDGNIDLSTEKLNLTLYPKAKKASLISLAIPLNVRGTLAEPSVRPNTASVVKKVAGGILGGLINPIGLLVPLVTKGSGDENPCLKAMSQPKKAATAKKPKQEKKKAATPGDTLKGTGNGSDEDAFGDDELYE